MNIATAGKVYDTQLDLFEGGLSYEKQPLRIASSRNFCGDFFEEATAVLFGGKRIRTDGTKEVCPDIFLGDGRYLEAKSVGCSGAFLVYESRLAKDEAFIAAHGAELSYVLWRHRYKLVEGTTLADLRDGCARTTVEAMIIPLAVLAPILHAAPIIVLNKAQKRRGYGAKGYNNGWRMPYNVLARQAPMAEVMEPITVYGREVEISLRRVVAQC